jgi:tetratricopeptide (TPR) repeat protein
MDKQEENGEEFYDDILLDSVDYRLHQFFDAPLTSEDPDAESSIQSQLKGLSARYEWQDRIAVGGVKSIDRVLDLKTNTMVAMARPKAGLPDKVYEPFLREARLSSLLKHPNIITVHDIGLDEEQHPYFTMELKQGDSLSTILDKLARGDSEYQMRYGREVLLGLFQRICDAVAYAHSEKVLHLDLKPSNIQIGRFGGVQVCDWGLAKILGSPSDDTLDLEETRSLQPFDTMDGRLKGTPGYMAPEQVEQGTLTPQADIYALGCLLFTVLTYQEPLRGDADSILRRTAEGDIRSPMKACPENHIPESLDAVVMKAMALSPGDRYQSVEELQHELQRYLAGYSTSAENAGVRKLLRLLYRRNRALCWNIGVALAVISVGTLVFINKLQQSEKRAVEQKDAAVQARGEAEISQKDAEEKLRLYLAERAHREELEQEYTEDIVLESFEFIRNDLYYIPRPIRSYNKAIEHLDKLLQRYPDNQTAIAQKGFLLFVMQRFDEALVSLQVSAGNHAYMVELCRKYGDKSDDELLPPDQVASLLHDIRGMTGETRLSVIEKLVSHYSQRRRNTVLLEEPMKALLQTWNPDWTDQVYQFDGADGSLTLGGKGLSRLLISPGKVQTSGLCVLRMQKAVTLRLRCPDRFDLGQLYSLSLSTLDVRGSRVENLEALKFLSLIHELVVEPGQLSEAEKALLPRYILVSERPLPE